jgi:hypothetical protein
LTTAKTKTTQHNTSLLHLAVNRGVFIFMPMTEQQIQTKIKRKLIERGWYVTKLIKTSTNGIPDLLAIKYGKAMFIEVKREGGKLSPIQELRIEELKAAGAIVKVWTDFDTDFI